MPAEDCGLANVLCHLRNAANSVLENIANAVTEAVGKAVASVGTLWVNVPTPVLTGAGGDTLVAAGSSAPHSAGLTTVLGYVSWVCAVVAVLSLFALGGLIAVRVRAGEGLAAVGRLGLILGAVMLISGASALVAGVLPAAPDNTAGAVLFLQSSLWWYMGIAAVAATVIGGARMCWEQRADPGKDVVKGLCTLVVVAGAGVTIVGLLVQAADGFSVWIIGNSLRCDLSSDAACFGRNITAILGLAGASGLGVMLIIVLGLVALFASLVQIVLMVARGGMLVILAGIFPLSASFTTTETGKTWFRKCVAWLVAFILYKPAAAIVYAAAFQLTGTSAFGTGDGLVSILIGVLLMVLALFAMPALLRFVTPMVAGLASGAGGAAGGAALAGALPSGAAALGRLAAGRGGGPGGGGGSSPGGDTDTSGSTVSPSGSSTGSGGGGKPGGGGDTEGTQPDQPTGGEQPGQAGGSGQPAGADAATSAGAQAGAGGATATGAGAGTAGAGAAGAGAAAGPVGAAAEVGVQAARAGAAAVRGVGEHATGDNSN